MPINLQKKQYQISSLYMKFLFKTTVETVIQRSISQDKVSADLDLDYTLLYYIMNQTDKVNTDLIVLKEGVEANYFMTKLSQRKVDLCNLLPI